MATRNVRKFIISVFVGVTVTCISLNTFTSLQKEIKDKDQLIQVMQLRDKQLDSKKYSYLTAARDLQAGETVRKEDIQVMMFSQANEDGLSSEEMVIGNVLLSPVKSGEILTGYSFTGISSSKTPNTGLREGYRALTLATSTLDGLAKEMKAGSYVDIFSKSKNNSFVLSKIRILSLEPASAAKEENTSSTEVAKPRADKDKNISITQAKTVTFEVPLSKIQELVEIYSSGKILLVMRPIGDDTVITNDKSSNSSTKKNRAEQRYDNYSYNTASLPPLPPIQTFDDPTINNLPVPVSKPKKEIKKTVELIEAGNKTEVSFD